MPAEPAWLVVTVESGERRYVRLDLAVTTIGRSEGNVLDLMDSKLSRFHCEVHRRGEAAYVLRDCGSRNGTEHNGHLVSTEVPLRDGDRIDIGNTVIVFHARRPPEAGPRDQVQALAPAPHGKPLVDLTGNTPDAAFDPRPTLELPRSDLAPAAAPASEAANARPKTKRIGRGVSTAIEGLAEAAPEEVLGRLVAIARDVVPARQASVLLPPARSGEPPRVAALAPTTASPRFSTAIVAEALTGGNVVAVADAKVDPRYQLDVSVLGLGLRGAIAVPIRNQGRVRAVLYLDDPKDHDDASREDAILALRSLAAVAGLAAAWSPGPRDAATARLEHDKSATTWVQSAALAFAPASGIDIALKLVSGQGSVVASAVLGSRESTEIALLFAHIPGAPERVHGLAPAVAAAFRALASSGTPGERLLPALEDALEPEGGPVAAALVRVDPATGAARLAGAGLGHALLRRASGEVQALPGGGAPLGSGAGAAGIVERPLAWEPGDLVLLASPPHAADGAGPWLASQTASQASAVLEAFAESRGASLAGAVVLKRL